MIKKNLLYLLPVHLFYLIPIFLITGPFLSDLAVTIISIIFLIIVFKEKKFYIFNNKFFYFFIFFYLYLVINSLSQNQNLDSLRISISFIRFGLFSLALMYFIQKESSLLKKIFYSITFTFIILILDGFLQYFTGKNILGWELIYPGPRVSSFFGEELILGSYIARIFPILLGLIFFFDLSKNKMILFSFMTISSLFLVLISGERTAFFLMILSFILMLFLIYKKRHFIRNIFIIIITFCILILFFSDSIRKRIVDVTLEQMLASKNKDKKTYIISRQHDEHYESALRMFKKNLILGVGVKNFRVFCSEKEFYISDYTCSPHPHNTYIQLLSETGIIGFLSVFGVFLYLNFRLILHFIRCLKKQPLYDDFQICLLVTIYLTLWPLVPSGNFFNNWLSIIYFYPVGIMLWSINKNNIQINKNTNNI